MRLSHQMRTGFEPLTLNKLPQGKTCMKKTNWLLLALLTTTAHAIDGWPEGVREVRYPKMESARQRAEHETQD